MKNLYRPEIDGLRALAVLSVIFFHAGIEVFQGGFVGVDVFFVVSGYLITTIILKDIEKGKFSLTYFYQRRCRRILPALLVTIILSFPIALILLPPNDLQNFSKSVISSLSFWSNFQFSSETGYFATPGEYKPLLHTWSLSIEEQFYIFYPLLFIILFKLGKKIFNFVIITLLFLSLGFAQWSGNLNYQYPFLDENLSFYSQSVFSEFMMPFGRIWELALGAFCAFLPNKNIFSRYFSSKKNKIVFFNFSSFIGISLIFFSFFYLSRNFPYPSFYSMIPTIGTALLIIFATEDTFMKKILSNKILVFIGLISYSAYLFHYPIFSFIKYSQINIDYKDYIYLIPAILFLSFLNWKYIEKPFRNKNTPVKNLFFFIFLGYLILLSASLYIYKNDGLKNRSKFAITENIINSFKISEEGKKCIDIDFVHLKKNQDKICKIGNKNSDKIDFIVFGDSHVTGFHEAFNNYGKENNKSGLFVGYAGCPPILNIYSLRPDQSEKNCYQLNKLVSEITKEKGVRNLFFISRWTYYTGGESFNTELNLISLKPKARANKNLSRLAFQKGLQDTLEFYSNQKARVFIFEQVPYQNIEPEQIYYRSFNDNKKIFNENLVNYSVNLSEHEKLQKFVNGLFQSSNKIYKNLTIVPTSDFLCDQRTDKCLIGNNINSFYADKGHLNRIGARLVFDKAMKIIVSNTK